MNERIKQVRKTLKLTQEDFGARLGLSNSGVSKWEKGDCTVPDSAVISICREFGVNEVWLRTGAGEMFRPRSEAAELAELVSTRLVDAPDAFQAALVRMLLRLEPNGPELMMLRDFCELLAEEAKKGREP